MRRPHCCPVCNNPEVKTTLQDYPVNATVHGLDREVQGLAAFQCENGHFFFLCRTDLVTDEGLPFSRIASASA